MMAVPEAAGVGPSAGCCWASASSASLALAAHHALWRASLPLCSHTQRWQQLLWCWLLGNPILQSVLL